MSLKSNKKATKPNSPNGKRPDQKPKPKPTAKPKPKPKRSASADGKANSADKRNPRKKPSGNKRADNEEKKSSGKAKSNKKKKPRKRPSGNKRAENEDKESSGKRTKLKKPIQKKQKEKKQDIKTEMKHTEKKKKKPVSKKKTLSMKMIEKIRSSLRLIRGFEKPGIHKDEKGRQDDITNEGYYGEEADAARVGDDFDDKGWVADLKYEDDIFVPERINEEYCKALLDLSVSIAKRIGLYRKEDSKPMTLEDFRNLLHNGMDLPIIYKPIIWGEKVKHVVGTRTYQPFFSATQMIAKTMVGNDKIFTQEAMANGVVPFLNLIVSTIDECVLESYDQIVLQQEKGGSEDVVNEAMNDALDRVQPDTLPQDNLTEQQKFLYGWLVAFISNAAPTREQVESALKPRPPRDKLEIDARTIRVMGLVKKADTLIARVGIGIDEESKGPTTPSKALLSVQALVEELKTGDRRGKGVPELIDKATELVQTGKHLEVFLDDLEKEGRNMGNDPEKESERKNRAYELAQQSQLAQNAIVAIIEALIACARSVYETRDGKEPNSLAVPKQLMKIEREQRLATIKEKTQVNKGDENVNLDGSPKVMDGAFLVEDGTAPGVYSSKIFSYYRLWNSIKKNMAIPEANQKEVFGLYLQMVLYYHHLFTKHNWNRITKGSKFKRVIRKGIYETFVGTLFKKVDVSKGFSEIDSSLSTTTVHIATTNLLEFLHDAGGMKYGTWTVAALLALVGLCNAWITEMFAAAKTRRLWEKKWTEFPVVQVRDGNLTIKDSRPVTDVFFGPLEERLREGKITSEKIKEVVDRSILSLKDQRIDVAADFEIEDVLAFAKKALNALASFRKKVAPTSLLKDYQTTIILESIGGLDVKEALSFRHMSVFDEPGYQVAILNTSRVPLNEHQVYLMIYHLRPDLALSTRSARILGLFLSQYAWSELRK